MEPAGSVEFVIVRSGELMVSESGISADTEALSITFSVKLEEPAAAGVPATVPLTRSSPDGKAPANNDQVYGGDPPVAFSG